MRVLAYILTAIVLLSIGMFLGMVTTVQQRIVVSNVQPEQSQAQPSAPDARPAMPGEPGFDPDKLNQAQLLSLVSQYYSEGQYQVAAAMAMYMAERADVDDAYKGRALVVLGSIAYKMKRPDMLEVAAKKILALKGAEEHERAIAEQMLEIVRANRPEPMIV